jgi:hypothetical protein
MGDPFDRDLDRFRLDPDGLVRTELPVTKRRRDKSFLPAIPERLFCRLVQLPGKCLAVYMVLTLRCRLVLSQTTPCLSAVGANNGT